MHAAGAAQQFSVCPRTSFARLERAAAARRRGAGVAGRCNGQYRCRGPHIVAGPAGETPARLGPRERRAFSTGRVVGRAGCRGG